MPKYFGTDGVRAVAGEYPLVKDFIEKLGYSALKELSITSKNKNKFVIMAEDSRISGPTISKHLIRGIKAAGYDVWHLGIAPTPAVSYLTKKYKAICGVVISASHNPAEFNGIKFFSSKGTKLDEKLETKIENLLEKTKKIPAVKAGSKSYKKPQLLEEYKEFLKSLWPKDISLKGTKIVLDCANGATSVIAPKVFKELGATVKVIANKPTGLNINKQVGALFTQKMQDTTKKYQALVGFSFDGDGDRLIASDEKGHQLDGDNIISACALFLKEKDLLKNNKVVLTIMANLGLINYLKQNGIEPLLTKVGDKYVFESLNKEKLSLGGETSGHIIFKDIADTGDGLICALEFLAVLKKSGKKPSWYKEQWQKYPLNLLPVRTPKKVPLEEVDGFLSYLEKLQKQLGQTGRILVRYSGTEPLLRILVEGQNKEEVQKLSLDIAEFYKIKMKIG